MSYIKNPFFKKKIYRLYNEKDHLKYPTPESIEIRPIGKTITSDRWDKFCKRCLTPKLTRECKHKIDGTITFHGKKGLEIAAIFQKHFKDRFRLRLTGASKLSALRGLQLAIKNQLMIHEIHYKGWQNTKIMVNDRSLIHKMAKSIAYRVA
jgi:hypothetical protein